MGSGFNGTGNISLDLVAASYSGDLPQDVFPSAAGLLVGTASPTYLAADDFNGVPRSGSADIGAYRWVSGGNPGWTLAEAFKQLFPIFQDGFESGDKSYWSATQP